VKKGSWKDLLLLLLLLLLVMMLITFVTTFQEYIYYLVSQSRLGYAAILFICIIITLFKYKTCVISVFFFMSSRAM